MNVVFRADASLQIGTGHVMRCLTLANALKAIGAECQFICREHPGNLIEHIRSNGHITHALPAHPEPIGASLLAIKTARDEQAPAHSHWLGATQEQDASECMPILSELQPAWLIVDHYALDSRWEVALKSSYGKLMVIDDLADRTHECDLLLDQNLGRVATDYSGLVPEGCAVLVGPEHALLRPEFAQLREYSLARRRQPLGLRHLLISMGGADQQNATQDILKALRSAILPKLESISVVMGASAPWLKAVRDTANLMPWRTDVLVNVTDMARRMADCDLAIGAAGGTAWERCCLGVPTVVVVLADNQRDGAKALSETGAVVLAGDISTVGELPKILVKIGNNEVLARLSRLSSSVTTGLGVKMVVNKLVEAAYGR